MWAILWGFAPPSLDRFSQGAHRKRRPLLAQPTHPLRQYHQYAMSF